MNNGKCCVGGITDDGRYVRLLTNEGENHSDQTDLAPRQVHQIDFIQRPGTKPPHVEDVLIQKISFKDNLNPKTKVLDFIKKCKIPIWQGSPENLFDGSIKWTHNGSGYINEEGIPAHSVGFWVSDKSLSKGLYYGKTRYNYKNGAEWLSLPYVGFEKAVYTIPAGTLLRVSLARWWDQKGTSEQRCSLQLSGWYDI
jgi:hypothetical protein